MKVVIAHGSFGKPHENWIPWLEGELDKLGVEYLTPTFPTPAHQNYQDWERILDIYRAYNCFGEDTIFIGHSCGAAFLAKYIARKNIKCNCYISASGYNNFYNNDELMDSLNSTFYLSSEELASVAHLAKNRIAVHSDNDPFIPQEKLKEFVELIHAKEYVVPNGGHLNASAGLTQFNLLLDLIKSQL